MNNGLSEVRKMMKPIIEKNRLSEEVKNMPIDEKISMYKHYFNLHHGKGKRKKKKK